MQWRTWTMGFVAVATLCCMAGGAAAQNVSISGPNIVWNQDRFFLSVQVHEEVRSISVQFNGRAVVPEMVGGADIDPRYSVEVSLDGLALGDYVVAVEVVATDGSVLTATESVTYTEYPLERVVETRGDRITDLVGTRMLWSDDQVSRIGRVRADGSVEQNYSCDPPGRFRGTNSGGGVLTPTGALVFDAVNEFHWGIYTCSAGGRNRIGTDPLGLYSTDGERVLFSTEGGTGPRYWTYEFATEMTTSPVVPYGANVLDSGRGSVLLWQTAGLELPRRLFLSRPGRDPRQLSFDSSLAPGAWHLAKTDGILVAFTHRTDDLRVVAVNDDTATAEVVAELGVVGLEDRRAVYFEVNGGWLAFWGAPAGGVEGVWLRHPDGRMRLLRASPITHTSWLYGLTSTGEVAYSIDAYEIEVASWEADTDDIVRARLTPPRASAGPSAHVFNDALYVHRVIGDSAVLYRWTGSRGGDVSPAIPGSGSEHGEQGPSSSVLPAGDDAGAAVGEPATLPEDRGTMRMHPNHQWCASGAIRPAPLRSTLLLILLLVWRLRPRRRATGNAVHGACK